MQENGAWFWTKRQRSVLAVLVLLTAGWFFLRAMRQTARIDDPPPATGENAANLLSRIDPNTADWPAFAALPLIGEKRAKDIVAFREAWQAQHPDEAAFEKLEDLTRVKGIGKATITTLEPYLVFPQEPGPLTSPPASH